MARRFLALMTLVALFFGFFGRLLPFAITRNVWQGFCSPFYCFFWLFGFEWPFEFEIMDVMDTVPDVETCWILLALAVGLCSTVGLWYGFLWFVYKLFLVAIGKDKV